jgi:hypothetical protein
MVGNNVKLGYLKTEKRHVPSAAADGKAVLHQAPDAWNWPLDVCASLVQS